jgi:hypothetical protein
MSAEYRPSWRHSAEPAAGGRPQVRLSLVLVPLNPIGLAAVIHKEVCERLVALFDTNTPRQRIFVLLAIAQPDGCRAGFC